MADQVNSEPITPAPVEGGRVTFHGWRVVAVHPDGRRLCECVNPNGERCYWHGIDEADRVEPRDAVPCIELARTWGYVPREQPDPYATERTGPYGGNDLRHEAVVAALTQALPVNEARRRRNVALARADLDAGEERRRRLVGTVHEGRNSRVYKENDR